MNNCSNPCNLQPPRSKPSGPVLQTQVQALRKRAVSWVAIRDALGNVLAGFDH
jgi:hypothetical protein